MNDRGKSEGRSGRGLRALWRGEFPLRFVFWVLNVGVHVFVNAVLAGLEWWGERALDEPDAFRGAIDLFAVAIIVLYAVYTVVAWVGLWRSAGRYPGWRLWRSLARLTVIASVLWIVAAVVADVPVAAEVSISEFEQTPAMSMPVASAELAWRRSVHAARA